MIKLKESEIRKEVQQVFLTNKIEISAVKIPCLQAPINNPDGLKSGQIYDLYLLFVGEARECFYMLPEGDLHLLGFGILDFSKAAKLQYMDVGGEKHQLIYLPDGSWKFVPQCWLEVERFRAFHPDISLADEMKICLNHHLFFGYVFGCGEQMKAFDFIREVWISGEELAVLWPELIELGDTIYYFGGHKFMINQGVIKYFAY